MIILNLYNPKETHATDSFGSFIPVYMRLIRLELVHLFLMNLLYMIVTLYRQYSFNNCEIFPRFLPMASACIYTAGLHIDTIYFHRL